MALNNKIKLNLIAKNFDLKNKDLMDILQEYESVTKTSVAALDTDELNIIWEHLTFHNQVDDIEPFLSRTVVKTPAAEELPSAKDIKAPVEEPVKPVQEQPKEIPVVNTAPEIEVKNKEPEAKPAATAPYTQKTYNNQNNPNRVQSNNMQQQRRPEANTFAGNNQFSGNRPQSAHQGNNRPQPHAPSTAQQTHNNQTPANASPHRDNVPRRPDSKREFIAPTQSAQQKPRQPERDRSKQNNAPHPNNLFQQTGRPSEKGSVDLISETDIKFGAGVKGNTARIVDTRTVNNVDLSKYDEKLDRLAPDKQIKDDYDKQKSKKLGQNKSTYDRFGGSSGKDKSKKGAPPPKMTYDRFGKLVDKEKMALEKMQKMALEKEKAKKKQLHITLPDAILVSDLASKLHVTSAEVVKKLFMLGTAVNVTQMIDYDTAALCAMEFGAKVEREVVVTIEDKLFNESEDTDEMLVPRSPVVVVMGHVDHGKTSLLDAIKNTNVTAGEAGGITQHIGAYRVNINDKEITFLDTPGHAAFTAMRARGAQVTDIAILVVAANDGVMPQTVEAINHAKAAGVSIIVAINKMDLAAANPERVKQELANHELLAEEWGGSTICVPVSATQKQGIDELLEMVLLTAEMMELKANPNRLAKGAVIEAKLDKGKGPVATVLVQNGTLNIGDIVIAGTTVGRIRAMNDYKGKSLKSAPPSFPVEIVGLSETPNAGDDFRAVEDEKMARELVEQRKSLQKEETFKESANISLEDLFAQVTSGIKELNLIIKADVHGSVEALKSSLEKESTDEVKIRVIHKGVGGINESDVMLASASNAIIIGFNVRPDKAAIDSAERNGVDVRTYRVIYECIEEINAAMKGMLAPKFKEVINGHAQVRQTIRVPNVGTIAGSYVQDGKITRNSQIRVVRDGIVIFEDKISSLKRFKDDVREVAQGFECGIGLDRFNDIKELDILESFVMEEIER